MLSLLIFIGEAVRDAFDPRKTYAADAVPAERTAGDPTLGSGASA
jgi:microcin C transport system permease protein